MMSRWTEGVNSELEHLGTGLAVLQSKAHFHIPLQEEGKEANRSYHLVRRWHIRRINLRYSRAMSKMAENWEHTDKPCPCGQDHNALRLPNKTAAYIICPIRYYILLAWRAITERKPVPDTALYWKLLNKSAAPGSEKGEK